MINLSVDYNTAMNHFASLACEFLRVKFPDEEVPTLRKAYGLVNRLNILQNEEEYGGGGDDEDQENEDEDEKKMTLAPLDFVKYRHEYNRTMTFYDAHMYALVKESGFVEYSTPTIWVFFNSPQGQT